MPVTRAALRLRFERFLEQAPAERAGRLGIDVEHAALVPAGYALLETLLARLGVERVFPTTRGVAEGLLDEALKSELCSEP